MDGGLKETIQWLKPSDVDFDVPKPIQNDHPHSQLIRSPLPATVALLLRPLENHGLREAQINTNHRSKLPAHSFVRWEEERAGFFGKSDVRPWDFGSKPANLRSHR